MANGATSLRRSPAGLTKRKFAPLVFDSGLLASDLERCCRCKNQWNRLAGRNKRAAASEPSEAKRAKLSPATPDLGSAETTALQCDECATSYSLAEIGISKEEAHNLVCWRCGVCKGTHVRTKQPARAKKVRRCLIVRCVRWRADSERRAQMKF